MSVFIITESHEQLVLCQIAHQEFSWEKLLFFWALAVCIIFFLHISKEGSAHFVPAQTPSIKGPLDTIRSLLNALWFKSLFSELVVNSDCSRITDHNHWAALPIIHYSKNFGPCSSFLGGCKAQGLSCTTSTAAELICHLVTVCIITRRLWMICVKYSVKTVLWSEHLLQWGCCSLINIQINFTHE